MAGTKDEALQPKGFQSLNPTTATALTVPAGSRFAMFNIEGASAVAWFRDDGVDPTAAAGGGIALTSGTNYWYTGKLPAVKFITTSTFRVNVSYYA